MVYILGGVLGAAELMATQYVIASGIEHGLLINGGMWIATACIVGLYARSVVKRVALPNSLVSPRMLGTWFAVSLGCLGVGMFNELQPIKLSYNITYPTLLIDMKFITMALQTRRWLLAPAVAFYAGALAIAFNPTWGYEILATVWLLSMVGVGIGLKSGAELEEGA